jgi:hypothetical protein
VRKLYEQKLYRGGRKKLNSSTKLVFRTTCHRLLLLLPKRKSAQRIRERATLFDATRHTGVAGRYIEAWVSGEEVARPEKQGHGLCRHDGEIFWAWEVCDSERVP